MLNVEDLAIQALRAAGIDAFDAPPADRPDEFATVEEVGRRPLASGFKEAVSIAVQAWAASNWRASQLMDRADEAVFGISGADVCGVSHTARYRFPSDDGVPRYQSTFEITIVR